MAPSPIWHRWLAHLYEVLLLVILEVDDFLFFLYKKKPTSNKAERKEKNNETHLKVGGRGRLSLCIEAIFVNIARSSAWNNNKNFWAFFPLFRYRSILSSPPTQSFRVWLESIAKQHCMRIHFVWPFGFPFSCGSTSPVTSYRPAISRLVNSELSDLRRSRPSLMSGTIYSIQVGVNPVQIYTYIYTARLSWLVGHHAARSVCAQSNLDSGESRRELAWKRGVWLSWWFSHALIRLASHSHLLEREKINAAGWCIYTHRRKRSVSGPGGTTVSASLHNIHPNNPVAYFDTEPQRRSSTQYCN